jgi:hypothetical protein
MRLLSLVALLALAAPFAQAQNVSLAPTYGDVSLEEGFTPDPHETELTAGGSITTEVSGCVGKVAEAPDVDLRYSTSGGSTLYIYAISGVDTTLLVNLPNGSWSCDDDSFGDGDPIVIIENAPSGLYDIWVGTFGDELSPATLYISEIDPR